LIYMSKRKPGISVLIACQNEEALIALCIRSFLDFGDELIIVDNGSTDSTKEIVRSLQSQHPEKIKFFDVPQLPDLYQNRQYAFEQSSYEWIVRADADFVAYTDGEYNIMKFREYLLGRKKTFRPEAIAVPMTSVMGDFWHTGIPNGPEGTQVPEAMIPQGVRFYRHFPSFCFLRQGRREVTRFWRLMKRIYWDKPLWMHCSIKTNMNHFIRSERTNWRQFGDFKRFPTLNSYIESVIEQKYGTKDFEKAAVIYMERNIFPYLERYDPEKYYPYPTLICEQMKKNPIYRISTFGTKITREFIGLDPLP